MPVPLDPVREQLPTPLAFAFARATSLNAPAEAARDLALALAEYATAVDLALALARGPLPSAVEEAMGSALNTEPSAGDWCALLEALGDEGPARALDGADVIAALQAWPGRSLELVHVAAVRADDAAGMVVNWRLLRGTSWPDVRESRVERAGLAPGLWLLSGGFEGERVPVPEWLAYFEDARLVVRLFAGRSTDGRWRYATRTPMAEPFVLLGAPRPGTPIWLRGLAPAHAPRSEATGEAPTLHSLNVAELAEGVARRLASDPVPEPPRAGEGRLVLRVVAGRQLMSFAPLAPGSSLVIGRSAATAQVVVQHGEVSRAHARVVADEDGAVRACDLGSANGTRLDGRALGRELTPMPVGAELRVGPVVLRLERLGDELVERLERIAAFQGDTSRDPLTGLLQPSAVYAEVPAAVEGTSPVSGIVLDVDRLGALHAQHGQEAADAVFQTVARLIMFATGRPELCVRLHYGRILVVLPGVGAKAALDLAGPLATTIRDHRWASDGPDVTVSGAVGERRDGEALDTWVMRLGTGLNQGRLERGRNRVFAV